jgi:hypothetical protein
METLVNEYKVLKPSYTVPLTDFNIEPTPLKRAHVITVVQASVYASTKELLQTLTKGLGDVVTVVDLHFNGALDISFNTTKTKALRFDDLFSYSVQPNVLRDNLLRVDNFKILTDHPRSTANFDFSKIAEIISRLASTEKYLLVLMPDILTKIQSLTKLADENLIFFPPTEQGVTHARAILSNLKANESKTSLIPLGSVRKPKEKVYRSRQITRFLGNDVKDIKDVVF